MKTKINDLSLPAEAQCLFLTFKCVAHFFNSELGFSVTVLAACKQSESHKYGASFS